MLNKSNLVAFIASSRPEEAKRFYADTLGLKLLTDDPFAIVFDAHGLMLRVQKLVEHTPPSYTMLGWDVADIHVTIRRLSDSGVKCERFEGLAHDESGVWESPSGAQIAWFKDPDGNLLSLTQA